MNKSSVWASVPAKIDFERKEIIENIDLIVVKLGVCMFKYE